MKGEGEVGGGSQGGGGANSGAIRDDDNAARRRLGTASTAVLSARPLRGNLRPRHPVNRLARGSVVIQ
jgi:hypothetical protein